MYDIFITILPVFLILAIGYGAVKIGYLNVSIADGLNATSVQLIIPIMLFMALYRLDFEQAFQIPMLVGFYTGAFLSFGLTSLIARKFFKRKPGEAIAVGFAATFSNSFLLGIPIAERALGSDVLPFAFGIIAFHAPLIYIVGIVAMEFARSDSRSMGQMGIQIAKTLFANALMIGILAGAIFNLLGIHIPNPVYGTLELMSKAAFPMALLGIGAALTRYKVKSEVAETALVSCMSLLFHPAIAFVLTHFVFDLPMDAVKAAIIIAAMPPGINIYIFANMYNRATALAASALVVATTSSIISISLWLSVIGYIYP